jgi:hypothetical protein
MSEPDVKKFTERDLGMIYDKIVEKVVTDICESLVDGKRFTEDLRETLVEKMSKILDRSDTESKMNAVIIQGMNTSLRRATNGPLLLYALLRQSSRDKTMVEIEKIFKSVHDDSQSVYQFRKKLMTELQTPPYKEWFPSTPSTTTGGGKSKRKTRKKSTRKKRKLKNKTRRGGGIRDYMSAAASNAKSGISNAASRAKDGISNAASGAKHGIAAAGSGLKTKMGETGSGIMANARGMKSAAGDARRAAFSGIRNAPGAVGNAMYNAPGAMGRAASGAYNAATGQQEVELSETDLEQNSNELYEKYHKKIIEMITKKMDDTAGDITKKMTNVSYVYMMEHGKNILDSTLNTLDDTIQQNQSIQDVFPILVVQALYQARNDVVSAIMSAEKQRQVANKSDTFEKPDDAFVAIFREKLMNKLKIKVGDVDPNIK